MRIVLVTGIYPPDHGGPAKFVPQLAAACHEQGWDIEVITLSDDLFGAEESPWRITRLDRQLPKWKRLPLTSWRIFRSLRKADVMFANGLYEEAGIAAIFARRPWVGKFVGDPVWERYRNRHREHIDLNEFQLIALPFKYRVRRAVLGWVLRRASCLITPSNQLADLLTGWGVKRVRVIPNGVELTPLTLADPVVDVATVARLVPWKHIDQLISVCSRSGFSLEIVGDGPDRERLSNLVDQIKPERPIRFRGSLEAYEVPFAIDRAKVFALLSSYEGMSFALLEAMSRGRAVVVGNNPGNTSVVEDGVNGLVVSHDDPLQIEVALRRLIDEDDFATMLGKQARATIEERFSIANTLSQTIGELLLAFPGGGEA